MPIWNPIHKSKCTSLPDQSLAHLLYTHHEKALYGLCSSGLHFHEKLSSVLHKYGFHRSRVNPDLWMQDVGDLWEYVIVYVDDIIVAMKGAKHFFDELQGPNVSFTMKGVGKLNYHLGADFFYNDDGTLCFGSQTYAKRLCSTFETLFGEQPKPYFAPLDHEDHPELDDSPLCGPDDTAKYQSLIGPCQWMVSLCWLDIVHALMSLSRFCQCPQKGHIEQLEHVCGYIKKFPQGALRIRMGIPDHESVFGEHPIKYNWMETVYGDPWKRSLMTHQHQKETQYVHPPIVMLTYCMTWLWGGLLRVSFIFFNQTPTDWFSKQQNQVKSATYGSEFMAA